MFSVLIPTWNNLPYLKLCVESIRKTSHYPHEIIVHVNEGHDGTLDWVRSQGLKHSYSPQNLGVCLSVNHLAAQASNDWLVYMNDDMVCCPGWDTALVAAIESAGTDLGLFFSTLIEPVDTDNPLVIFRDFGTTPETFRESELYAQCQSDPRGDRDGVTGQPTVVHRRWWHLVGGYSIEFGPGMSSDDDLMMKLWVVGARLFRTVGASRIYHFSRASTGKVRRNRGGRTFVMKWGLTQHQFTRKLLPKAGQPGFDGTTSGNPASFPGATFKGWTRRIYYGLKDYPLGDLRAWDPSPATHLADSPSANAKKVETSD